MAGPRIARICCLDLDTFFVSVERLLDPTLEGRPVVVGGARGTRGVVTAASYEVRAFGVRSGMPMAEASRLAPAHTVFLPTRHDTYGPYAERVKAVLERFTPVVQTASIDEFFLDFRGCERLYRRPGDPHDDATVERTVRAMCQAIRAEVGLPASAGVGTSRMVAKIASGLAKPAGVRLVPEGQERVVLAELPVRKVPGIGPATEARLLAAQIRTVGELLSLPSGVARLRFGPLADRLARTLDGPTPSLGQDRPAFLEHDAAAAPRSMGTLSNERTFHHDVGDPAVVEAQLAALAERVCWRARRRGVRAAHVGLKLRYADFDTLVRSMAIEPTDHEGQVRAAVLQLYHRACTRPLPIRLLGVSLSDFVGADPQLSLGLERPAANRARAGGVIDELRERYGYEVVRLGAARAPRPRKQPDER